jgi:hypothetical protein
VDARHAGIEGTEGFKVQGGKLGEYVCVVCWVFDLQYDSWMMARLPK